ncbi:MAG: iron ABC transporter permease, partial [Nocardioides sp.]|nr:iron ABC transporter permease [Nocardioides sp.]
MRRVLTLAATAAIPLLVLGIFFGLPVWGMLTRGFVQDGHLDLGGVADVLARPEIRRAVWFTLWSSTVATVIACVLGLPAAYVLHRVALPGRTWIRAVLVVPFVLPTVVVGVAFELLIGPNGPLGPLDIGSGPIAIVAGLVFFNASVVIRVVGGAWESLDPRAGEA